MNMLITGGAGFIGSAFVRYALDKGHSVTVLDKLTYAGRMENLDEVIDNINFVKGDICDKELVIKLLRENNINYVVNFAAESHVDNSISSPEVFVQTNVNGTVAMLAASTEHYNSLSDSYKKSFRYLQISTDEVFGDLDLDSDDKFHEELPHNPSSPYSASKSASDGFVKAWNRTYKLPTIITNCSNNYGARQFKEKLIPHMVICATSSENLPVYGDGKNVRDWIHVDDHCHGVYLALTKGKIGQTYCLGGNAEVANIDLVNLICEILDNKKPRDDGKSYKEQITFVEDRKGHDRRYAIDDSKAEKELGFKRKYNFRDGLEQTIEWYLNSKG